MTDLAGLRAAARAILDAAIAAGDARRLTREALAAQPDLVPAGTRRILVVGAGKASGEMASAAEACLGDRVAGGVVVVKALGTEPPARIRLLEAGHPLPDERGRAAAGEVLRVVGEAGAGDLVLCLISGGGSALLPLPVAGITLAEKQAVTRLLLEAGATINELNAVRKHLSALKGGQLARAAAPARVVALLLSDVIGDPLDVIASGPTAPDPTTFGDALEVVDRFGLRARLPAPVRRHLEAGSAGAVAETPKPGDPVFGRVTNRVIGNNRLVVDAALEAARRLGYPPLLLTTRLQGEAREAARVMGSMVAEAVESGQPVAAPACLLAGGETTVTVRGRGKGGRCQEFCLAIAPVLAGRPGVLVLAAGTDGTDGPTDAAGATADGTTVERARRQGLDLRAALAENDAYRVFEPLGDLVVTGPTGTNLLDLYLALLAPPGA